MKKARQESNEVQDLRSEIQALERSLACFKIITNILERDTVDGLESLRDSLEEERDGLFDDLEYQDKTHLEPLWQHLHDQTVEKLKSTQPFGIEGDEYTSLWQEFQHASNNSILNNIWDETLEGEIDDFYQKLSSRDKLRLKLATKEGIDSIEWWKLSPDEARLDSVEIEEYLDESGVIRRLKSMVLASCHRAIA